MLILFGGLKTTLRHDGTGTFLPGVPEMLDLLRSKGLKTGLWTLRHPTEKITPAISARFTEGHLGDRATLVLERACPKYGDFILVESDLEHLHHTVPATRWMEEIVLTSWEGPVNLDWFLRRLETHAREITRRRELYRHKPGP